MIGLEINNGLTNTTVLTISVSDGHVFAGTKDGLFVSDSGGQIWSGPYLTTEAARGDEFDSLSD